jgi:hypothetical protein
MGNEQLVLEAAGWDWEKKERRGTTLVEIDNQLGPVKRRKN